MLWAELRTVVWVFIAFFATTSFGWIHSSPRHHPWHTPSLSQPRIWKPLLIVIDPNMLDPNLIDVTIAVVSAAAGAASQLPRIQELEKELSDAKLALTASEQDMVEKIKELEDKLFLMDEEFERQTEKVRKQYDKRMWDEVARMTEKAKVDFQYKLEIKVEEEKARLLQDKLLLINQGTKRGELAELRLKQSQIEDTNHKLEQALKDSQSELEKIQNLSSKKGGGWWPF